MGALLRPLRFCLHRSSSSSSSSTYETADNRDGDILLEGESDEEWEPSRDEIFEPPYSDSEASSSDSENDSAKRSRSHTAFGKFFFTRASLPSDLPVPGVLKRRKKTARRTAKRREKKVQAVVENAKAKVGLLDANLDVPWTSRRSFAVRAFYMLTTLVAAI